MFSQVAVAGGSPGFRMLTRIVKGASRGADQGGFTLIEVLVVLIVIGILLAIAVPSILSQRNRAGDASARANVRVTIPAITAYYGDHATYVGMTLAVLQAKYDQGLSDTVAVSGATATSYCVEATVSGRTWRQNGPARPIERASC
jgi:prepilin-type N-terminal cleavage/methylation domain-containing protein